MLDDATLAFAARVFDLARDGDAGQLADLLDGGLPVDLTTAAGDRLLVLAAYHAHPAVVELLLDRGADPARANDRGQTALAAAVFRQCEPAVRALLAVGAAPAPGAPAAGATARVFDLPAMVALLEGSPPPGPTTRD